MRKRALAVFALLIVSVILLMNWHAQATYENCVEKRANQSYQVADRKPCEDILDFANGE